jgi:FlaA1/EpsC-like NDP-sugar epimerase
MIGTDNVLTAAVQHGVKRVICLSTDKAVYPINAMGISKAMMQAEPVLHACKHAKPGVVIGRKAPASTRGRQVRSGQRL